MDLKITKDFAHAGKQEFFHLSSRLWHFLHVQLPQLFGLPDHRGKVAALF